MQVVQQSNRLQRMKSVIWAHKAYTVSRNPLYGGNAVFVGTLCRPQASKPFFKNLALFLSIRRYPELFCQMEWTWDHLGLLHQRNYEKPLEL